MTWCPTCGGDPCILPSFCALCRKADARLHRQPPSQSPDRKRAAESTIEALMYSLRQRGVCALDEPDTKRRLSELDDAQAIQCGDRLLKLKIAKTWTADEVRIFLQLREQLR